MLRFLSCILAGLTLAAPARADDTFYARVKAVAAGDRLTVQYKKKKLTIRLHGVDCPEPGQPFFAEARKRTAELVRDSEVKVEGLTRDANGRRWARVSYLARIHRTPRDRSKPHQWVRSYLSLQRELVQEGLAWWNREQATKDKKLAEAEVWARKQRRGLWADKNPVAPWRWRKTRKAAKAAARGSGVLVDSYGKPPSPEEKKRMLDAVSGPPQQPPSEGRACKADRDCVFAPRSGCGCPLCGNAWRRAVNRKRAAWLRREHARESCPKVKCARCSKPVRWLGKHAVCVRGQCTVKP